MEPSHVDKPVRGTERQRAGSLVVFSDDWGRHPSSCQHLVRHLLSQFPVLWINTIGLRQPRLDWFTAVRGWEKVRQWLCHPRRSRAMGDEAAQNPRVLNPIMWPSIRFRWERRLNCVLLRRQLTGEISKLPRPRVLVTTIPLVADLIGHLPVDRWVYYCVDDFRQWPGMAGQVIAEQEVTLVRAADLVIAAGQRLAQHIAELGKTPHILTHGVDLEIWASPVPGPIPEAVLQQTRDLEKPWIVFWGSTDWRMDTDFLTALANRLNRGTIVLVGPVTDCDPVLRKLPRLVLLGPVPYPVLPWFAQQAAVLIMPYRRGGGMEELEPLKLREFLATDRPIVVRDLPANRLWQDALDLVDIPEEFAARVLLRIEEGVPAFQLAARARVQEEGWPAKARQFAAWLFPEASASS